MIEAIIIISAIFVVLLVLYKFKVLTDDDNDMIPDEIEVIAEEIHDQILSRAGDVFDAAEGSKRKGVKKG